MSYRVGIVGGAGYAGIELVRRVIEHPDFELAVITSSSDKGVSVAELYPALVGICDLEFSDHDDPALFELDLCFLAVPHTASLAITPKLLAAGVTVIDLSADFRLKDPKTYEKWYHTEHTAVRELAEAAFGLPELFPDELARVAEYVAQGGAGLVACAGCFPTATGLASALAVRQGYAEGPIYVQAISGVTGAGRKASGRTHFCAASENVEAYGVGVHRHTPEIEQILDAPGRVVFIPHLAPLRRGLLSTVTLQIPCDKQKDFSLEQVHEQYVEGFSGSPFVQVLPLSTFPRTDSVSGTNMAQIGLGYQEQTSTLICVCAIDNLGKGAADQAVQCANIVLGLPQDRGLTSVGTPV